MSASSEFNQHSQMLHDCLHGLFRDDAVEIEPGRIVPAGLLRLRVAGDGGHFYHPRVVVISGAARLIGDILGRAVREDLLIVGKTRQDDSTATMSKILAICPGTAKDVLNNTDLDEGTMVNLSHSVRTAEPEILSPVQASFYYQRILDKLEHP